MDTSPNERKGWILSQNLRNEPKRPFVCNKTVQNEPRQCAVRGHEADSRMTMAMACSAVCVIDSETFATPRRFAYSAALP